MTKEQVKEKLPLVRVQIGQQIFDGRLSGRKNPFATVTVMGDNDWFDYQFSWDTVTNAINNKRPLKV